MQSIPHLDYDLAGFRKGMKREIPVFAAILSSETDRQNRRVNLSPDGYRASAKNYWKRGFDGIELFNFFMLRASSQPDLPLFLLNELGDADKIGRSPDPR